MKYKQGDILIDDDGDKAMILAVTGLLYGRSMYNQFDVFYGWLTEKELDEKGWKLETKCEYCGYSLVDGGSVEEKEIEVEKLYLEVNRMDGDLTIVYKDLTVGYINTDGRCHIVNTEPYVQAYEQWRKDGMLVDHTVIDWIGAEYCINEHYLLKRVDIGRSNIYNFENNEYKEECQDDNIVRHEHNERPIAF